MARFNQTTKRNPANQTAPRFGNRTFRTRAEADQFATTGCLGAVAVTALAEHQRKSVEVVERENRGQTRFEVQITGALLLRGGDQGIQIHVVRLVFRGLNTKSSKEFLGFLFTGWSACANQNTSGRSGIEQFFATI